jgi:hypothetical protein
MGSVLLQANLGIIPIKNHNHQVIATLALEPDSLSVQAGCIKDVSWQTSLFYPGHRFEF